MSNRKFSSLKKCPPPSSSTLGSTSRAKLCLNATLCGRKLGTASASKSSSAHLETQLIYNNYLQALMKHHIVSTNVLGIEQDLKDQLAVQEDKTAEIKATLRETQNLIAKYQKAKDINAAADCLKTFFNEFFELAHNSNLEEDLFNLCSILKTSSNKINLVNIQPITNQEDYDYYTEMIKNVLVTVQEINIDLKIDDELEKFVNIVQKYKEVEKILNTNKKHLCESQLNVACNLLRNASDLFANNNLV